jgi:hypothetical protein
MITGGCHSRQGIFAKSLLAKKFQGISSKPSSRIEVIWLEKKRSLV